MRRKLRLLYVWSSLAISVALVVLTAASFAGATLAAEAHVPIGGSLIVLGNARCCRGGAMIVAGWARDRASFSHGPWHGALIRNTGQDFYPAIDREGRYFGFELARQSRTPYVALLFPTVVPLVLLLVPPGLLLYRDRCRRKRAARGCCARCGYDLRMSPGRCPECGPSPRPAIRPAHNPPMRWTEPAGTLSVVREPARRRPGH